MTASSIPVGTTGKSLQTFENDLGAGAVHSEAVTLANSSGVEVGTQANPVRVREVSRSGGNPTPIPFTVTLAATPFTHTPASGKAIRLFWITAAADPAGGVYPRISVTLPSATDPTREIYRARSLSHSEMFEGAADAVLSISISANATVDGTVHIEEYTP